MPASTGSKFDGNLVLLEYVVAFLRLASFKIAPLKSASKKLAFSKFAPLRDSQKIIDPLFTLEITGIAHSYSSNFLK